MILKNGQSKIDPLAKYSSQGGNAIVFLFAAIAMAGTVTYGLNNVMRGPGMTVSEISRQSIAENNLIASTRLAVVSATTQQASGGDCDGDGFVEPLPYRDAGANPKPTGGGLIPMTMGASVSDPWSTQYGYCVWDPGSVSVSDANVACGGATPRRLQGAPRDDQYALTIISAGKNAAFETVCSAYVDTTPADGKPDTPLVDTPAGSDDIVLSYTYAEANGIGGGVWKVKDGDPTTATVAKNLDVAGGATFTDGPLTLQNKGLVLPGDPGDDTVTGPCDEAKDQQLRRNIGDGAVLPTLEICDYNGSAAWVAISGGGTYGGGIPSQEIQKLVGSDSAAGDEFATSFDIEGDTIAVGARLHDLPSSNAGAVYIFTRSGDSWAQTQKINAADAANGDSFGIDVALSGTTLAIGSQSDDDTAANSGSVYIFTNVSGTWTQTQKLHASDPAANDLFGRRVTLSGNTIMVTATDADASGADSGAVYVFTKSGSTWTQTQKLVPGDLAAGDTFGLKITLQGDTAIISATNHDSGGADAGAAYVYKRTAGTWTQTQKLEADDGASDDKFGRPVLYGDTAAISSANSDPLGADSGAVYIFKNTGSAWTQTQKLTASDGEAGDNFSSSTMSMEDGILLISSQNEDEKASNAGAVYVFTESDGEWTEKAKLITSDGVADDVLDNTAISNGVAVIGSKNVDTPAGDTGAAYVFAPSTAATNAIVDEEVRETVPSPLDVGLTAHWKLDEGTGTAVNDSVGTYHGSFVNTPIWNSSLKGGGLSFALADRDAVQISGLMGQPSTGTIAAWVNIGTEDTSGNVVLDIGNYVGLSLTSASAGKMSLFYWDGGIHKHIISTDYFPGTGWHYVVGTFDSTNNIFRIYIDGLLSKEETFTEDVAWTGQGTNTFIGRHGNNLASYDMDGGLDDIRLYNRALGPGEVVELTNRAMNESLSRQRPHFKAMPAAAAEKFSVGNNHSCLIKPDGTAWCWGKGDSGQLGNGGIVNASRPVRVQDSGPWRAVSAGRYHSCGIKTDGTAWCWGEGSTGQLGDSASADSVVPVKVSGTDLWVSISAGENHNCAIRTDETIWCWGENSQGAFGNNTITPSAVPVQVTNTGPWISVSAGQNYTCGIKNDSSGWCWGSDFHGRLGNGSNPSTTLPEEVVGKKIWSTLQATKLGATCGIDIAGKAWCWGYNQAGSLGNISVFADVITQAFPLPVSSDGPWAWISPGHGPHGCGTKIDGTVWCWGYNGTRAIGNNTSIDSAYPVRTHLPAIGGITTTGSQFACAQGNDGRAWCWGAGFDGNIGNGVLGYANTPALVSNVISASPWSWNSDFTAIALQDSYTLGLGPYWMSDDGAANKYFGFQSKGRALLRQNASNNQLLIDTTLAASSSQINFRGGHQATPSADDVSYRITDWLFQDGSGTTVAALNPTYNGTIQGTAVWNTSGGLLAANDALEFDASIPGRVSVTNHVNLRPIYPTIEIWIKPRGTQGVGATLITKTHSDNTGVTKDSYALRYTGTNELSFITGSAGGFHALGPVKVEPDRWTHIVATHRNVGSAPNKKLFVNGVLVASAQVTDAIAYDTGGTGNLYFGAAGCTAMPCQQYNGAIGFVRLHSYSSGLSDAVAYQLYKSKQSTFLTADTLGLDHTTNALEFGRNNITATNSISAITPDLSLLPSGNLAIGSTTANALVDVNGGVRVGYQSACTASNAGTIRNDLGNHYECTGNHNQFIARESDRAWEAIASSSDGQKLVAAVNGGQIYTSVDYGISWTPRENNRAWKVATSSADGVNLAIGVEGGQIYTSTDSGATWIPRDSNRAWNSLASSADGSKLVAATNGGQIYTSTDSGATWVPRDSNRAWFGVASSKDGVKLVAVAGGEQIYTSTDSGVTWTPTESSRDWRRVTSSADGVKLVAIVNGGQIYTSTDSGATWIPRESNRNWTWVTSSADGSRLAATVNGGQIYVSTDSGVTWSPRESNKNWNRIASSADGTQLAVTHSSGKIYISKTCTWKTGTSTPVQKALLEPSDPQANAQFGFFVSLSENTALSSTQEADSERGAVYAHDYASGAWTQAQKIVPADVAVGDRFGSLSKIDNETVIIGSSRDDDTAADSGSAYVFAKSGGTWTQAQKLNASDPTADKRFGATVTLNGNTALIGAWRDSTGGADAGAVYVFTKSGGTWAQTQKLVASDPAAGDQFGANGVDLEGDVAVIGAAQKDSNKGAVYVFTRSGGVWAQTQKLEAADGVAGDAYGRRVVIENGHIFVAAHGYASTAGAVYVYTNVGGTWTLSQKLTPSDANANDNFAQGIDVKGNIAVISSLADDDGAANSGSAYVFQRIGDRWAQVSKFAATVPGANDQFGSTVSISGDRALLAADLRDIGGNANAGSTYIFDGLNSAADTANPYKYCDGTEWKKFPLKTGSPFMATRKVPALSAGLNHTCSIKNDGTLWCWGQAASGQLGNGTIAPNQTSPIQIGADTWDSISGGSAHTCGIKDDRTLWCWGEASLGKLGNGTTSPDQTSPIQIGTDTWSTVSAGHGHTCGIKADGTLWCWGNDGAGQLGDGAPSAGRTSPFQIGTDRWNSLTAGWAHSCGIKADGTLWCWGWAVYGQLGNGSTSPIQTSPIQIGIDTWSSVSGRSQHTCGIKADGTLWCWGQANQGKLGNGTTSPDQTSPIQIGADIWNTVSTGSSSTCGIMKDRTLWCWGLDSNGALGDGSPTANQSTPVIVGSDTWINVSPIGSRACAIKTDGSAWCWGNGTSGERGDGLTSGTQLSPKQVLPGN